MKVIVYTQTATYAGDMVDEGKNLDLGESLREIVGLGPVLVLVNVRATLNGGEPEWHQLLIVDRSAVQAIGVPDDAKKPTRNLMTTRPSSVT